MTHLAVVDAERCVGCQLCMFACQRRFSLGGFSRAAILPHSRGGLSRGLTVTVCRACEDPPCAAVCPTEALKPRQGGGVVHVAQRCLGCGHCLRACLPGAIFWDEERNKPVFCVHCGTCARYCPHGVLALVKEES
ncbi:4Fe-4S dicluster domain-containing protein [Thermosulfuriphilus ammonigenes]|uniref:4Fe-4S dicluster domain-containing protein n=1 Tax=Thermosulfuriphilus ammonigenes TaxID=1936021 RepID=A0A6G7PY01_9BACT|nr:4Fe-4S dicluster domain-containing protein [Thermosulfuriphilus ammonigenes]MBA2849323.1 Fe-S-cluster-containing dehydrogenase component [Thermosulfuriphilus ammonigenes]QIJ72401.1 4Fe-4S dicluster domain-containing protein [Thermosulfuriphilus ammonigenes]